MAETSSKAERPLSPHLSIFRPLITMVMSIVQETQADQSEGRLGMELVRIRAIFERLRPGSVAAELLNQYVVTYARPESLIPPEKIDAFFRDYAGWETYVTFELWRSLAVKPSAS